MRSPATARGFASSGAYSDPADVDQLDSGLTEPTPFSCGRTERTRYASPLMWQDSDLTHRRYCISLVRSSCSSSRMRLVRSRSEITPSARDRRAATDMIEPKMSDWM